MKLINKITHRLSLFLTMVTLGVVGLFSPEKLENVFQDNFLEILNEINNENVE